MPVDPNTTKPSYPVTKTPIQLVTDENRHVTRVVALMKDKGLDANAKVRDDMKLFMVYAYMAETNLPIQDVVLVQQQLDTFRTIYFFAEKLPGDQRFAAQYQEMDTKFKQMKDELCTALNRIAALETENANLRGTSGD